MTPKDAVSNVLRSSTSSLGAIVITNVDSTCAKINASQSPKNAQLMTVAIGTRGTGSLVAPTAPGTFPVYSFNDGLFVQGPFAVFGFESRDAFCHRNASYDVISGGTLTLTRVDANGYSGTFDVTFTSSPSSHVTGSFSTALCTALTTNSTATSCI
jgi:hypothetical protein